MMNRRQFVYMGGAALFAHVPKARAATYDLLIEGGRVIDPSVGLDPIRDIAIAAGKTGADNIDQIATVARTAPQVGRALVNIARTGVISPAGELHDMNVANVALAQGAIARHRDVVVGVKARLSENVADANDLEALR